MQSDLAVQWTNARETTYQLVLSERVRHRVDIWHRFVENFKEQREIQNFHALVAAIYFPVV